MNRKFEIIDNQLIILGNGFDLHIGMNSSFEHFFKNTIYKNNVFSDKTNNILYLLFFLRFYNKFLPQAGFFRRESQYSVNWMDIESFIKKIATEDEFKDGLYKAYQFSFIPSTQSGDPKIDQISQCLSKRNVKDGEGASFIGKLLYDDLNEFIEQFKTYLIKENAKISKDSREKFLRNIIYCANKDNDKTVLINDVVNFNYTTINDNSIEEYNIHGTLSDRPIIGYDSSSATIKNLDFFELSKEWQKLSVTPTISGDSVYSQIIFYGHSLGEQDYPFFFRIFNQCEIEKKDSKTILIFCYSVFDDGAQKPTPLDKYKMNIVKLVNAYERSINPNTVRNNLYTMLFNMHRLKLLEIKD